MNSILYVPGLGGNRSIRVQRAWVSTLNIFRRSHEKIAFFDTRWETDEPYADKFERLRDFHEASGRPVNIWAVSAGATLAVRLCVEIDDDTDLHIVCGKVYGPEKIGQHYIDRAPAFLESAEQSNALADQLDPSSCTCYIPKDNTDGVIESIDMQIPGARTIDLPAYRHAKAIVYALGRYLPSL